MSSQSTGSVLGVHFRLSRAFFQYFFYQYILVRKNRSVNLHICAFNIGRFAFMILRNTSFENPSLVDIYMPASIAYANPISVGRSDSKAGLKSPQSDRTNLFRPSPFSDLFSWRIPYYSRQLKMR